MEINGVKIDKKTVWRDAEKEHKRIIDNKKKQVLKVANDDLFLPYPSRLASHFENNLTDHLVGVLKDLTPDYKHSNCDTNVTIGE